MFYRIRDEKLYDYANYKYAEDCKETDIITVELLQSEPERVIVQDGELILNPEWATIALKQEKGIKTKENDTKRDERLASGVTFNGVIFDCDTDQKVNIMAKLQTMAETDTTTWFAMDNTPVEMTKQDLTNLGLKVMDIITKVWTENANIKYQIAEAKNIAEVKKIYIDYNAIQELEVG